MDTLILQLLCGQLRVSGGGRMDDQALTSATFASREKICSLSINLNAASLADIKDKSDGRTAVREVLPA